MLFSFTIYFMTELWLNFKNENGLMKRVSVEGARFTVGRTSDNDLCVPFPELSRRHLLIERSPNAFIVSDAGSSNGTTLDGFDLIEPAELRNGQTLNLGGGLDIRVELVSAASSAAADLSGDSTKAIPGNEGNISAPATTAASTQSASSNGSGSIPFGFFLLAPILVFVVLGIVGVIVFISRSDDSSPIRRDGDLVYASPTPVEEDEDEPDLPANKEKTTPTPAPTTAGNSSGGTTSSSPDPVETSTVSPVSGDNDKIERASVSFLRRIAANDSREFLTGKQIAIVAPKINQLKSSSALSDNLKNTKQNSSQLEALAQSKRLRPQFVAAAALTQLGNQRGDVLKTAQGMIEVLNNLRGTFGNELANDNLLMIAVYDQGVADKVVSTRDMIAGLANKFPDKPPQEIRTIWFLRENGKLSDSQFDFVLRFIAIGIIMQNPKDFNVQSEAVIFN